MTDPILTPEQQDQLFSFRTQLQEPPRKLVQNAVVPGLVKAIRGFQQLQTELSSQPAFVQQTYARSMGADETERGETAAQLDTIVQSGLALLAAVRTLQLTQAHIFPNVSIPDDLLPPELQSAGE